MPSTYTPLLNLEKPAAGEQNNTWGATLNTNLDKIDAAFSAHPTGWELLSSTIVSSTVNDVRFAVPTGSYYRFRLELARAQPVAAGIGYVRFSQDGGVSYKNGSTDYTGTTLVWNSGGVGVQNAPGSFIPMAEMSAYPLFGAIEFDYFGAYQVDVTGQNQTPSWSGLSQRGGAAMTARITNVIFGFNGVLVSSGLFRLLGGKY